MKYSTQEVWVKTADLEDTVGYWGWLNDHIFFKWMQTKFAAIDKTNYQDFDSHKGRIKYLLYSLHKGWQQK